MALSRGAIVVTAADAVSAPSGAERPPPAKRRWSRAALQLGLFLLMAFNIELLCQNLLYASNLESPNAIWRLDPIRGRSPSRAFLASQRLNRHGLRGVDPPSTFPPEEVRVMCFGSSVTYGWRNDEASSYPVQLEPLLLRERPSVRVYNAGWPSFTTCEMTALLVELEPVYRPHIVTIMCGVNDLPRERGGTGLQPYRLLQPDAARAVFRQGGLIDGVRSVLYRSATYRYLSFRLRGWAPHPTEGMAVVPGRDAAETASLTMSVDNLTIFAAYARERSIKLLLIDEATRPSFTDQAPMQAMRATHAALAQRVGLGYLDMGAALGASGLSEDVLFQPRDLIHLTPEGNKAAARAIASRLSELGWLRAVEPYRTP